MEKFTIDRLSIYSKAQVGALVSHRDGETKLGEKVWTLSEGEASLSEELASVSAKFVLLGIPEDIGVRANLGVGGTGSAWPIALKTFLNIQSNSFLSGDEILVLGHFEIAEPADQSIAGLRAKTAAIDELVYPVIEEIVRAGKIPLVVGGGHNNAFPIIWGTAAALQQDINVVNIDAHADLRNPAEGRHSGNGFSHALAQGYLGQYRVFGLHQNYAHKALPGFVASHPEVEVRYFEQLLQSQSICQEWHAFVQNADSPLGLEIDLDSIENVLSSASSPSGFRLNDIRRMLMAGTKKYSYLHICEGAVKLADGREDVSTGKAIAYLLSDFIKNYLNTFN